MLKPFQIRDLHDPSFQPDTSGPPSCCDSSQDITSGESSHSADWYRPSRDHITEGGVNHSGGASPEHHISDSHFERSRPGVVQISAREYDETIASHPHSSLMYMDDDDGETVTVCYFQVVCIGKLERSSQMNRSGPRSSFLNASMNLSTRLLLYQVLPEATPPTRWYPIPSTYLISGGLGLR